MDFQVKIFVIITEYLTFQQLIRLFEKPGAVETWNLESGFINDR